MTVEVAEAALSLIMDVVGDESLRLGKGAVPNLEANIGCKLGEAVEGGVALGIRRWGRFEGSLGWGGNGGGIRDC